MKARSTILLCEDNDIDVALTLNALVNFRRDGIVDLARDGVEALEYLRQQGSYAARGGGNPNLVLLDLKMPRLDRLEVLPATIVMLSSSRQENDFAQSYGTGANAYVVKSVDAKKFARAVEQTGIFWTTLNETPPSGERYQFRADLTV